jgi:hypothetical protein
MMATSTSPAALDAVLAQPLASRAGPSAAAAAAPPAQRNASRRE